MPGQVVFHRLICQLDEDSFFFLTKKGDQILNGNYVKITVAGVLESSFQISR